jgi:hypothetical protein
MAIIPTDLASNIRQTGDLASVTQPAQPTQKIGDLLQEFVPGQRMMATIQAILPNGAYRALVGQREVTLALPFAAKMGDALELEVVENKGRTALAVVGQGLAEAGQEENSGSVLMRLTQTGKLIAGLLVDAGQDGKPQALNSMQAILPGAPEDSEAVALALKDAVGKSGLFYESHQAKWAQGQLPVEALLAEPQGKLSNVARALSMAAAALRGQAEGEAALQGRPAPALAQATAMPGAAAPVQAATPGAAANAQPSAQAAAALFAASGALPGAAPGAAQQVAAAQSAGIAAATQNAHPPGNDGDAAVLRVGMGRNAIAPELSGTVRQQLEALASNTYAWQGQIWPGQQLEWEIVKEDEGKKSQSGENLAENWTTHLRLRLPRLGGVSASIRLLGGQAIDIDLQAESDETRRTLSAANGLLRLQFESAGLPLKALRLSHARAE